MVAEDAHPRRIRPLARALLALGVWLALGLVAAVLVAVRERRLEDTVAADRLKWEGETGRYLLELRSAFEGRRLPPGTKLTGTLPPRSEGRRPARGEIDPDALDIYLASFRTIPESLELRLPIGTGSFFVNLSDFDSWGHPFVYRSPGPVHPHGWDLYSVGPDGIDEQGGGDDILVGADEPASR